MDVIDESPEGWIGRGGESRGSRENEQREMTKAIENQSRFEKPPHGILLEPFRLA